MLHNTVKHKKPANLTRSANAPRIKAGVIGDAGRRQRVQADAVQHHLVESPDAVFEETAAFISGAEGKAVAEGHPQDADHPGYGQALHHQAQHVFLAHKAAVEQGDSGNRHHKHQKGCHYHPSRVA